MKNFKTPFLSALVFFGTLLVLSVWYAAWTSLNPSDADGGKPLTSVLMKWIIGNIIELKTNIDGLNATISGLVPTGTVIAYNWTSCPTGWLEANWSNVPAWVGWSTTLNLRWEFIRWLDNWRGIDAGRILGSSQNATEIPMPYGWNWTQIIDDIYNYDSSVNRNSSSIQPTISSWNDPITWSFRTTRPRNVALLYCVKQ